MSRRPRLRSRRAAAGAAALLLAAPTAWSAAPGGAELEEHFTRAWYYTEVVIFERPAVQDHLAEERLTGPPAPLAHNLRTFRAPPAQLWPPRALDPITRVQLAFPWLDHRRLRPLDDDPLEDDPLEDAPPDGEARPEESPLGAAPAAAPPEIVPRLAPDPQIEFLRAVAEVEASLARDSYRWLEPDTFTLTAAADALERRGGARVLLHGRWLQPVPGREAPEPLLIRAGRRIDGHYALEGTLDVTRGRFLHFGAHLLYSGPLLGRAPVMRALPPPGSPAGDIEPPLAEPALRPGGFMQLRERRRIRDSELHYLDHPKIGVIVRIEPVRPPESLVAAFEALQAERDAPR